MGKLPSILPLRRFLIVGHFMPAILKVSKTHRVTVTESEATLHYNLKSLSF